MTRIFLFALSLSWLCLAPALLWAGPHPLIVTDRPSQSDASSVVAPGTFQLEMGYFLTHDDDGGNSTTHTGPQTQFRLGVLEWLELRFFLDGYVHQDNAVGGDANGASDGIVGSKFYFWDPKGWRPQFALHWGVNLPFGADAVSSKRYDPFVRLLFTNVITPRFSIVYNLGTEWNTTTLASGARETRGAYTYTFLPAWTVMDGVNLYVEVFGSVPMEPGDDAHTFDAGVYWQFTPDWQVDLSAGVGLNDAADDQFIAVGLSTRWPELF